MAMLMPSVDIQIEVVDVHGIPAHKLGHSTYYIVLNVDGQKESKTEVFRRGSAPECKCLHTFAANVSSCLNISVHCSHKYRLGEDHIVGESEVAVLDTPRNQEVLIPLRKPAGNKTLAYRGSVTIRLTVDMMIRPIISSNSKFDTNSAMTVEDLTRMGFTANILDCNFGRITTEWTSLLTSLRNFTKVAEKISELEPKAKMALAAVTFAFEVVINQIDRDARIDHLIGIIQSFYDFLLDTEPLKRILSFENTVGRLLIQTSECAYFIAEYKKIKSFAARSVTHIVSNADDLIGNYEASFGELKIELALGTTLQTALTTISILEKVENIASLIHLDRLHYLEGASWDPRHHCLRGTRDSLIEDIIRWISGTGYEGREPEHIYLLVGPGRCGKSTIAHTLARRLDAQGRLGSAVFLNCQVEGRNQARMISSTIARELAGYHNTIKEKMASAVQRNIALSSAVIERQFPDLIVAATQGLTMIGPVVIIVDGINECDDLGERTGFLRVLAQQSTLLPPNFRIILTTRPGEDVDAAFHSASRFYRQDIAFDDARNMQDCDSYIKDALKRLSRKKVLFPAEYGLYMVRSEFTRRAMGIHLWGSTACNALRIFFDAKSNHFLDILMSHTLPKTPEETMGHLYYSILETIAVSEPLLKYGMSWHAVFRTLFMGAGTRISLSALKSLSRVNPLFARHPIDILYELGCIVEDHSASGSSFVLHRAFEDFLVDKTRCADERFYIDVTVPYSPMTASRCLDSMNNLLSYNLCKIEDTSLLNVDIKDRKQRIESFAPQDLRYACVHWISHIIELKETNDIATDLKKLESFFLRHLLQWIELMSTMGLTYTIVGSLKRLAEWLKTKVSSDNISLVMAGEAMQFLRLFSPLISQSSLHTYISALPLMPSDSVLYGIYHEQQPYEIARTTSNIEQTWSCVQVIEGHTNVVWSVSFSHDGSKIVSASSDKTIRIWDAYTGLIVRKFLGHKSRVFCAAFSPCGSWVASCSADATVRVWNVNTGRLEYEPLRGHTDAVLSVAYSPDGSKIISSGSDNELRIWDAATGQSIGKPLVGHVDDVNCAVFSHDGQYIASASDDRTVRIWDAKKGCLIGEPLRVDTPTTGVPINFVAWSPDGSQVASASNDRTVRIWSLESRKTTAILRGSECGVTCLAYSPDGSQLVSASQDDAIRIWDVYSGLQVGQPIRGHNSFVLSIAFSPDGKQIVSASHDKTIRTWRNYSPSYLRANGSYDLKRVPVIIHHCSPSLNANGKYKKHVNDRGWICDLAGRRLLWVPYPGHIISPGVDYLSIKNPYDDSTQLVIKIRP